MTTHPTTIRMQCYNIRNLFRLCPVIFLMLMLTIGVPALFGTEPPQSAVTELEQLFPALRTTPPASDETAVPLPQGLEVEPQSSEAEAEPDPHTLYTPRAIVLPEAPQKNARIADTLGGDVLLRDFFLDLANQQNLWSIELTEQLLAESVRSADFDAVITDAAGELAVSDAQTELPYAYDVCIIALSPHSPITNLSREDLRKIYSGRITNWQDLQQPSGVIRRLGVRDDAPGGTRSFRFRIMEQKQLGNHVEIPPENDILPGVLKLNSSADLAALLKSNPNAIAYGSLELLHTVGAKVISVDGVFPDENTIRNGEYPAVLTRRIVIAQKSSFLPLLQVVAEAKFSSHYRHTALLPAIALLPETPQLALPPEAEKPQL